MLRSVPVATSRDTWFYSLSMLGPLVFKINTTFPGSIRDKLGRPRHRLPSGPKYTLETWLRPPYAEANASLMVLPDLLERDTYLTYMPCPV